MQITKNLKFILTLIVAILFINACNLRPTVTSPETTAIDDRLTESDFAILIGRKSGLITYLGPNGNIFTINQAGRKFTPITADANLEQVEDLGQVPEAIYYLLPTWSTSGRKLAFAQHHIQNLTDQDFAQSPNPKSGFQLISNNVPPLKTAISQPVQKGRQSTYSVYAADANGENKQLLWSGTAQPIYMFWGPNETTLSILLQPPNGSPLQMALLSTQSDPATADTLQVLDVGAPLYWDWAPHGKQLLTHIGSTSPTERVSLLSLEDQVVEEVLDVAAARFASPDISPDGKHLLLPLESDVEGDDDTWVSIIDLATRKKSVVDKIDGDLVVGGAFSPNGSKIAYIASKADLGRTQGELAVYTLQTGDLVLSPSKKLIAFFWSPDSSKIALFEQTPRNSENNRGEGQEDEVANRPKLELTIFDVESEEQVELVQSFETTAQFLEVLTFYNQYQRSATIWSPDSRSIVLPVRTPEGAVIISIDISGKIHPRTLASGVLAFWSAE